MEMALSIPCGVLKEYRRKRLNFSLGIQLRKNEVNMHHFQLLEGKFQDMEQLVNGIEVFVYANISNFETETFEESEVRVYAYPFEKLYQAEKYELGLDAKDILEIKKSLIEAYYEKH